MSALERFKNWWRQNGDLFVVGVMLTIGSIVSIGVIVWAFNR